jgi:WD40 repeat protein
LWRVDSDDQVFELTGHKDVVTGVAFCRDETRAVSVSLDKTLKVWDLNSGRESRTMEGHQYGIKALALFHRDDLAVTGDESGQLIFWDLAKCEECKRLDRYCDLPKLRKSTTALWEVARGPEWKPSPEEAHAPCIESLAISPDDCWLVVAQRNRPIAVWDMGRELEVLTIQGHKGIIFGLALTCQGRRLISASDDNSLRVWDLETGARISSFTADFPLYCCSASLDGRTIVAGEGARSGKVLFLTLAEDGNRHGL